jgi:glycosyltransferase involved in cell wall biosynthesis
MAVLAVVTSSPANVEGGHLVIARALVDAARDAGHDARLVVTPDFGFGRFAESYLANWRTNITAAAGAPVDQVISLRYPSYAVRHPAHVCWLNHTIREYYDLWPRFTATISMRARVKEQVRRRLIHAADRWLLTRNVTRVVAQSRTIERRLANGLHVRADVVYPPAPLRGYRCDGYGDYMFAVSRLTPLKRVDLLVRALADPTAQRMRAVIAGEGEERGALEALARTLGVTNRVTFTGRISDAALLEHLARCRAVYFAPFDEDYGFVTVEAFASRKAVVTCHDSGGPAELVRDGQNGLVCDPTPASVALCLARLADDRAFAERLGESAAAQAATMTWADAVKRLLIA